MILVVWSRLLLYIHSNWRNIRVLEIALKSCTRCTDGFLKSLKSRKMFTWKFKSHRFYIKSPTLHPIWKYYFSTFSTKFNEANLNFRRIKIFKVSKIWYFMHWSTLSNENVNGEKDRGLKRAKIGNHFTKLRWNPLVF